MKIRTPLKRAKLFIILSIFAPLYSHAATTGLVIRGGTCSAEAFENDSGVFVSEGYISNLSVNCTQETNNKVNYDRYLKGIGGYTHYCVATMESLLQQGVTIKLDRIQAINITALSPVNRRT